MDKVLVEYVKNYFYKNNFLEKRYLQKSTLWAALGEQDTPIVKNKVSNTKTTGVVPVIGV